MKYTKTDIKKYLNQFLWNYEDNINDVPVYKYVPEYPNNFTSHFGNTPMNSLSVSDMTLSRTNFDKFAKFLISLGYDNMELSSDSYKFVDYKNKIIILGDIANPPKSRGRGRRYFDGDDDDDDDRAGDCHIFISVAPTSSNKQKVEHLLTQLYSVFLGEISNDDVKFYMIAENRQGLYTQRTTFKSIPIKDDRYDLFYGEKFPYDTLKDFITEETDNLMLLHGDPGTGKSNLIKHLITKSEKKVIYIPPSMLSVISSPGFVTFMMDNKNSILLIEDAEEVLSKDRNSATNNLLGLTDGFLKDALQLKVIATFNCKVSNIDPALMRKGRLYFEYKFDKLTVDEGRKLAKFMDLDTVVDEPMTIADIFNPDENSSEGSLDAPFMGFHTT